MKKWPTKFGENKLSTGRKYPVRPTRSFGTQKYTEPLTSKIIEAFRAGLSAKTGCTECRFGTTDRKKSHCAACGRLIYIRHVEVPFGIENRALKTVPERYLQVRESPVDRLGVFAVRHIGAEVTMGPYEGITHSADRDGPYSWSLDARHSVDGENERFANYLRYVNCPRNPQEWNVSAYRRDGKIYYRTTREIEVGEELLVYYGHQYAETMGIDAEPFRLLSTQNILDAACDWAKRVHRP